MVQFIDDQRDAYGVASICPVVPIAPSTYCWHKARHADPTRRSARVQRDDEWRREIQRVWDDNQPVYGPRTVWRLLEPIRYSPPAEYEERYYEQATVASLTSFALRRSRYGSGRQQHGI